MNKLALDSNIWQQFTHLPFDQRSKINVNHYGLQKTICNNKMPKTDVFLLLNKGSKTATKNEQST